MFRSTHKGASILQTDLYFTVQVLPAFPPQVLQRPLGAVAATRRTTRTRNLSNPERRQLVQLVRAALDVRIELSSKHDGQENDRHASPTGAPAPLRPFSKWAPFAFATNSLPAKKPIAGRAIAGYRAVTNFRCVRKPWTGSD